MHARINGCRARADVVVAAGGINKTRVAPHIHRAGGDGTVTDPIAKSGPRIGAPQGGFQRRRDPRRHRETHRVADDDIVGQSDRAILSYGYTHAIPTGVATTAI